MDNWRSDPDYTAFEPTTVQEAILKFRRLQKAGLDPWRYPETFVHCARKLPAEEVSKFESWIVNPQGEDPNAITVEEFKARIDAFIVEVKGSKLRPGFDEVLVPGELDYRWESERMAQGVEVEAEVFDELRVLAGALGIRWPF